MCAAVLLLVAMVGLANCDGAAEQPSVDPNTPPGVVQEIQSAAATPDSITLAWDPPSNADQVPVDRYQVVRQVPRLPDESFSVAEAVFEDTGLDADQEYRYRVRAISTAGVEGPEVDLVASTTAAEVKNPESVLGLRLAAATPDSITLAWDPPSNADQVPVDRYQVVRQVPRLPDESFSVAEAVFEDTGLDADQEYRYRVRAISTAGVEGPEVDLVASTTAEVEQPAAIPGVVLGLRADPKADSITLRWDPPSNADQVPVDRYQVVRQVPRLPDESFSVAEAVFEDTGLDADQEYRYRVRAISTAGVEGPEVDLVASTTAEVEQPAAIPGVVLGLRADPKADSITLRWDPPSNADQVPVGRYEVSREIAFRPDEQFTVAEPPFTDKDLSPDSKYRYRVRAISTAGVEGPEVDLVASTLESSVAPDEGNPGPVRNLKATSATQSSITIAWDPPDNTDLVAVERYIVTRDVRLRPDETYSVDGTEFTETGLEAGSQYRYRVHAVTREGVEGPGVDLLTATRSA